MAKKIASKSQMARSRYRWQRFRQSARSPSEFKISLDRRSAKKSDKVVNDVKRTNILGQALLQITVLLVHMNKMREIFGIVYEEERSVVPETGGPGDDRRSKKVTSETSWTLRQ